LRLYQYTNIVHCKTLQNLPKFGFLVRKQTIWQPWSHSSQSFRLNSSKLRLQISGCPVVVTEPKNSFYVIRIVW
jgi:hypothetical protein